MIDWARVNELRDEIGEDDFSEIAELFLSEVQDGLGALSTSMTAPEMEAAFHYLKGSALNLGFTDFAEICQTGETAAAQGNTHAVEIAEVRDIFAKTSALFAARDQGTAA